MLPFSFNSGRFSYARSQNLNGEGKYHHLSLPLRFFVQTSLKTAKTWGQYLTGKVQSQLEFLFSWQQIVVYMGKSFYTLPTLPSKTVKPTGFLQWFGFTEDTLAIQDQYLPGCSQWMELSMCTWKCARISSFILHSHVLVPKAQGLWCSYVQHLLCAILAQCSCMWALLLQHLKSPKLYSCYFCQLLQSVSWHYRL